MSRTREKREQAEPQAREDRRARKAPPVLHPFLFAVFPVLFLFARNVQEFRVKEMIVPAAVALALAAAAWGVLSLITRNAQKAGLVTSLLVLFIGCDRYLTGALEGWAFGRLGVGPRAVLWPMYGLALVLAGYAAWKSRGDFHNVTRILNVSAGCLVLISLFDIGSYLFATRRASRFRVEGQEDSGPAAHAAQALAQPSIFYIILDAYGRADNLKELYGYDNSETIAFLRSRGFYVAEKARSNYSHTILSLTSALNLDYLDDVVREVGDETDSFAPLKLMLEESRVRRFLQRRGYRFVSFQSGWHGTEIKGADEYLTPGNEGEFRRGLLAATAISTARRERAMDQDRILYTFDQLPKLARERGPLFVLAHIVAPHPPFVFTRDGEDVGQDRYFHMESANRLIRQGGITRNEYIARYREQLIYVNKLLTACIDGMLAASAVPPVIVVQGDHGPGAFTHHDSLEGTYLGDRMCIFKAYHIPGLPDGVLYDSITPVNTFRVIFNHCFGTDYPLLPDESYFATVTHRYRFTRVTDEIGSESDKRRLAVLKGLDYYPDGIAIDH